MLEKCSNNYREGAILKKKLSMGTITCGRPVVIAYVVGRRFPIILAEGKCMVENADSLPLIGRPSFDSTPLLIENR